MSRRLSELRVDRAVQGPHYHIWRHMEGPIPELDFDYCRKCRTVQWRTMRGKEGADDVGRLGRDTH